MDALPKGSQEILHLDPEKIEVGWRVRADLGDIESLATSISTVGQLQPIVISRNGNGAHQLIAGGRRLLACRQLSIKVMATVVQPKDELQALDMQLAENLSRKEFDKLEVGTGLKRRKELYEQLHPETRVGAAGRGRSKDSFAEDANLSQAADRFPKEAAQLFGISERSIYELLGLANLPEGEREEIEKAGSTRERNRKAQQALGRLRQARKKAKLEARARERAEQGGDEEDEEGERVVLLAMDNREYFRNAKKGSFEVILTDPPYESGRQSLIQHVSRGSLDKNFGDWDQLDTGWVVHATPLLTDGGHLLAFCPVEAVGEYRVVCEAAGLTYRGCIIWHKTNPGTVHRPVYLSSVEAIVWATQGDKYYFTPWDNAGAPEVHNFIENPICQGNERLDHPTQKPERVIERLLKRHSHIDSRVLDP
ncbi:MAG: ParB N-terminal domain-containing protein, partial [Actinobacteria bacterium]|nr:ParB N-terminal domain-containing protein [Actinomycetota bacterium]